MDSEIKQSRQQKITTVMLGAGQGSSMQALWATMGLVRPRAKTIAPIIAFIEIFTAMVNLQVDSFSRCCLLLHAVVVIGVRRSTEDDECSPTVPTDASCARGDPLYW